MTKKIMAIFSFLQAMLLQLVHPKLLLYLKPGLFFCQNDLDWHSAAPSTESLQGLGFHLLEFWYLITAKKSLYSDSSR